jgi:hypothetical protein
MSKFIAINTFHFCLGFGCKNCALSKSLTASTKHRFWILISADFAALDRFLCLSEDNSARSCDVAGYGQ